MEWQRLIEERAQVMGGIVGVDTAVMRVEARGGLTSLRRTGK